MYGNDFDWFVGKQIQSVELNKEKDEIVFRFAGGLSKRLGVEGDCCSQSWIEHLEMPTEIAGAVIQSVDEADMPPHDNHSCKGWEYDKTDEQNHADGNCHHDSLSVYHTRFRTDRGDVVLEYRNDSNGYYGGSLTDLGDA